MSYAPAPPPGSGWDDIRTVCDRLADMAGDFGEGMAIGVRLGRLHALLGPPAHDTARRVREALRRTDWTDTRKLRAIEEIVAEEE